MNTVSVEEIKARYDRDYKDRKFGGPDYTHEWIMRLLAPRSGKRLLDIGCSQGYLLAQAEERGLETYGIDISTEATELARRNSPGSEIVCNDAQDLSRWPDGYFDYITAIGTVEHFADPRACLREMARVMKNDGSSCIMLPNLHYYSHIINRVLWKKEPTSYQLIDRFASLGEWRKMIESNGFRVKKVHKYNKFNRSSWLIFLRTLTVPLYLSHHFVFICGKNSG